MNGQGEEAFDGARPINLGGFIHFLGQSLQGCRINHDCIPYARPDHHEYDRRQCPGI
ncbi:hypothetical protein SDC9_162164 [bioreactor metagenome]|uniref:Uncharacterized protein n=1 Tax=bioreactor metagenome TaxID=1076179 RepID=A0A645FKB5_9ZZZZ